MNDYYLTPEDEMFLDLITDELEKYNSLNNSTLCVF